MYLILILLITAINARLRNPWILVDRDLNIWSAKKTTTTHHHCPSFPAYDSINPNEFFKSWHDSICCGNRRCDWTVGVSVYPDWGGDCGYARKNEFLFHHMGRYQEYPNGPRARLAAISDPVKLFNVHKFAWCVPTADNMYNYYGLLGHDRRIWDIGDTSTHRICEVHYNGDWHYFDWNEGGWAADSTGEVYSVEEAMERARAGTWETSPIKSDYFWSYPKDSTWRWDLAFIKEALAYGGGGQPPPAHGGGADMSFCLRLGEKMERFYQPINDTFMNPNSNIPVYDPLIWGNSRMTYEPTLGSDYADYLDGIYNDSNAVLESDGVALTDGQVTWAVRSPYPIYSSDITVTSTGTLTKELSFNVGVNWEAYVDKFSTQESYDYLLRIGGTGKITGLKIVTIGVLNPGALPTLRPGNNNVRLILYDNDETITNIFYWATHKRLSTGSSDIKITSLSGSYRMPDRTVSFEREPVDESVPALMKAAHDVDGPMYVHYHVNHLPGDYVNDIKITHVYNLNQGAAKDSFAKVITAEEIAADSGIIDYTVNTGVNCWVKDPSYSITMEVEGGVLMTNMQNNPTYQDYLGSQTARAADPMNVIVQNVPNPFSTSTNIIVNCQFSISDCQLEVYDLRGKLVRRLDPSGSLFLWNGLDQRGARVPNGMYVCRLTIGEMHYSTRVMVLR
jgi:hypothetical protein